MNLTNYVGIWEYYHKNLNMFYYILCRKFFQAKALAEKNMRDLLAQKEQAERNVT